MPAETAQAPASQPRTCPQCGLSGFASLQGLSVHTRRVHGDAVMPRHAERAEVNAEETLTAPAGVKEINCPACESRVSSDGITVFKKSRNLVAFEEAEIGYSNLEPAVFELQKSVWLLQHAEQHRLERELQAVKKVPDESEEPKANIERLRAENQKLAKQIQELSEEPVSEGERRNGWTTAQTLSFELACVEKHGRKLAEQLKEIQAQAREPERVGSRNRTNEKIKSRTARA